MVNGAVLLIALLLLHTVLEYGIPLWHPVSAQPPTVPRIAGRAIVMRPASALIAAVLNPWLPSIDNRGSLKSAGMLIGYLERWLILTFVLLQHWDAIGFLITAKSILRFNEIKGDDQRPLSEYVLLGTLMSVTLAIAAGLLLRWTLQIT